MASVATEQVLVIPTENFRQLGYFQGFSKDVTRYFPAILEGGDLSYRPRGEMEEDPTFKQLIPYVLFRHRDAAGEISIFQYARGQGNGEARLRAKRSVGIGGHISTVDAEVASPEDPVGIYRQGLCRELEEEVQIGTAYEESCIGIINDDETEVGKVHLGVVHVFDVEQPVVSPREEEIINAGFLPAAEILTQIEQFESWSQIAMRALFT